MTTLEKILQEIENYETEMEDSGISCLCPGWVRKIIKKHLSENDGWIPCSERMPGTQKVLITDGDIVMIGYRRPDGVWKL